MLVTWSFVVVTVASTVSAERPAGCGLSTFSTSVRVSVCSELPRMLRPDHSKRFSVGFQTRPSVSFELGTTV